MLSSAPKPSDLQAWIGRTETVVDEVTIPNVRRIHAMLDHDPAPVSAGTELPIGWHSTLCAPIARQSEIGPDGHPRRGDFIPPIDFARRMAASARMTFHQPLLVGDVVTRKSTIENIASKTGRSGDIVFLTQKNEFFSPRGLSVTEFHEVAFRDVKKGREASPPGEQSSLRPDWKMMVHADPVLVFRYAAIAFSGHRIHYDYVYSTEVESYADVMVSGGLNLLLLFDLVRRHVPGRLKTFSSRNLRPLYVNEELQVCGALDEKDSKLLRLWIANGEGLVSLTATAELA
jgi:3-methylfumaryl-CoA hydratase